MPTRRGTATSGPAAGAFGGCALTLGPQTTMKSEFINRERWYELLSDEDGILYLDVVCGGSFMYSVVIRMTAEQVSQYKEEGVRYLDDVAYRVTKGEFEGQIVKKG